MSKYQSMVRRLAVRVNPLVVERDSGLCVECGRQADHVHHIVGRAHFGKGNLEDCWRISNLCCLCIRCHANAHTREARVRLLNNLKDKYQYDYSKKPFCEYVD